MHENSCPTGLRARAHQTMLRGDGLFPTEYISTSSEHQQQFCGTTSQIL